LAGNTSGNPAWLPTRNYLKFGRMSRDNFGGIFSNLGRLHSAF
jgi:hypothetical protein